jgi:hypothetical protein
LVPIRPVTPFMMMPRRLVVTMRTPRVYFWQINQRDFAGI